MQQRHEGDSNANVPVSAIYVERGKERLSYAMLLLLTERLHPVQ